MGAFGNLLRSSWGVGEGMSDSERHLQYEKEKVEKELLSQYKCDLSLIMNDNLKTRKGKYKSEMCHSTFCFGEWLDVTDNGERSFWDVIEYTDDPRYWNVENS